MSEHALSRRRVLRGVTAGVAATGMSSTALADAPGRKIVGLAPAADFDVARGRADSVHRELDFGEFGKAVAGRFSTEALDALEGKRAVEYVEDDGTVHALSQTLPWGVDRVDADVSRSNGHTANGVDVAIVDTGIDDDHPDLQANVGTGKAFVNCSGSNCNYAWSDDNDHGTHCAGIADAVDNSQGVVGVATEATLHAVKVLDDNGSGSYSDVAAGIEWVANQGYDVASMSLGGSSGSSTLQNACQYAYNNGVLLVAASGSSGSVGYPAAYSEVMAVSAINQNGGLASFSATGSEIEIAAPGKDIYSTTIGGYSTFSGTSMSAPHVSGAGAQIMDLGYKNTGARRQLRDTAEDLGLTSNKQGAGLVDSWSLINGCVDADHWPDGTGDSGYEHFTHVDVNGDVARSSGTDAYYDFTCPDAAYITRGSSFYVEVEFEDDGYNSHYCDLYVDWDKNRDWSTATQYKLFSNVSDDTKTYTGTFTAPSTAKGGSTLARLRLSWGGFDAPDATGQYGEVEDFSFRVV